MKMACILAAAFLLDCLLGDPRWLPHPICLMGKLIAGTEKGLRRLVKNEFFGGLLLVIVVITVSTAVPWVILILAGMINPWLETVLQVWFCYQILAMKSLCTESMRVYTPLKAGDLPLARKYLSWIVGRETDRLERKGWPKPRWKRWRKTPRTGWWLRGFSWPLAARRWDFFIKRSTPWIP